MQLSTSNKVIREQSKGKQKHSQVQTIFTYLQKNIATASMVAKATGIPHQNICRYKQDLEKAGLLGELTKDTCKQTGFKAWHLTTDPNKLPSITTQLNASNL